MQISSAREVITPTGKFFPCYLCGHAIRTEKATGVLSNIYVNTIVMKISGKTLLLCSFDLIGITQEAVDGLKSSLAAKYEIPEEQIFLSFIHTHSAPEYDVRGVMGDPTKGAIPGYMEFCEGQAARAFEQCFAQGFTDVSAVFQVTSIDGYYCNRNGIDKPCDKDITTVLFRDSAGRNIAGICSFTCHPTVLGPQNLLISPDIAGYLAAGLREEWGCSCFIMQGAAGDMSNRLYRQGNDAAELRRTGDGILAQIRQNQQWQPLAIDSCRIDEFRWSRTFKVDLQKKIAQAEAARQRVKAARTYDETKVYTSALSIAESEVRSYQPEIRFSMSCRYLQLGELSIFTMPAELFSRFGIQIKQAMGNRCNIFWGYNDLSVGYLYNREDAGESFESICSDIPAGTTEEIVDGIIRFIGQHRMNS